MSEVTNLINESKSLREEINSLNPVDHHSKPTIVVWGLMNAGKSYLLNMLSEHIENPYFKVAKIREKLLLIKILMRVIEFMLILLA